jgi:hypothetical protein
VQVDQSLFDFAQLVQVALEPFDIEMGCYLVIDLI